MIEWTLSSCLARFEVGAVSHPSPGEANVCFFKSGRYRPPEAKPEIVSVRLLHDIRSILVAGLTTRRKTMNWDAIGAIGELLGALVVVVTLGYLAIQIRQNTAQQKREETVSVQRGQNEVLTQLQDPATVRSYAMMAEKGRAANPEDRSRAIIFLVQYLNHFQIVYDLYQLGSLDEDRYKFWESVAVAWVASKGLREWWDEDNGKLGLI